MANKIGWCDVTINPIIGCSRVSAGCSRCYAEQMAIRLTLNPATQEQYSRVANGKGWLGVTYALPTDKMEKMFRGLGKTPKRVFVCSMSDLFHPSTSADTIHTVFDLMLKYGQHHYIILTKRPERAYDVLYGTSSGFAYHGGGDYDPNVFLGVSVENQVTADIRIPELLKIKDASNGAYNVGISAEPLLSRISLYKFWGKLDWVLAGSETGRNARLVNRNADEAEECFVTLMFHCIGNKIPLYFKQRGNQQHVDRILNGQEFNDTAWGFDK